MKRKADKIILLIEDNPMDALLLQEAVKENHLNYHFELAKDGIEGMKILHKLQKKVSLLPDLILLDLNMPKKNGLEVLQEIRQDKALHWIPVLVLSSSDDEKEIQKCYELHANSYISKPKDYAGFLTITKLIDSYWFHTVSLVRPSIA